MRANNKFRFISLLFSSDSDDDMTMVLLLLLFSLQEHGTNVASRSTMVQGL